jgi:hypothetical protein
MANNGNDTPFYQNIGRAWPIALSTGVGIGMSYADCERSFGMPRIPGTRAIPPKPTPLQSLGVNQTHTTPPSTVVPAKETPK